LKPGLKVIVMVGLAMVTDSSHGAPAAATVLKDVRFQWEGRQLILYADFNQTGHDLPVYLEWQAAGAAPEHRIEIDYIEQYARGMPVAITVAIRQKNAAGQNVLYMGQPRPNTPRIEGAGTVTGRIVIEEPQEEEYPFSIPPLR
jgi:hypothetical protein